MKQAAAANFAFIEPMAALRVSDLPVGDWLYELKFDGYRALAFKAGKEARLMSRNLKSLTANQATIDGDAAPATTTERGSRRINASGGELGSVGSVLQGMGEHAGTQAAAPVCRLA